MFRRRKKAREQGSEAGGRTPRFEVLSGEVAKVFDRVQGLHMIAQLPLSRGDRPDLILTALKPLVEALGVVQDARKAHGDTAVLMTLEGETYVLMGQVHEKAQQPKEARRAYQSALAVFETAGLLNDADRVRQTLASLGHR